jgi:hypothetical protein
VYEPRNLQIGFAHTIYPWAQNIVYVLTACQYGNNIMLPLISHIAWDFKYHLIWIPKYRKKLIGDQLGKHLGEVFR